VVHEGERPDRAFDYYLTLRNQKKSA
jgi:hypothetical protein